MFENAVFIKTDIPFLKDQNAPAPLFRRSFFLAEKPREAMLHTVALGCGYFCINGKCLDDWAAHNTPAVSAPFVNAALQIKFYSIAIDELEAFDYEAYKANGFHVNKLGDFPLKPETKPE